MVICTCLILHGSLPDNEVRLMNSGKCSNRSEYKSVFADSEGAEGKKPLAEE